MRLVVVRHAIAVARGTPGIPDQDRPLTPEGRARFERTARGLARVLDRPELLYTSPWQRARETAAILARAWGRLEPVELAALAGGSFEEQARTLDRHGRAKSVAVVGHEPFLSGLVARLLGSRAASRFELKKGGVAVIELPGPLAEGGHLSLFLAPRVLRRL